MLGASLLQGRLGSREKREAPLGKWRCSYRPSGLRAIADVRRALRALLPVKQRTRSEHTRLSVMLAELLDAHGEYDEASSVVDAIPLDALSPLEVALVRHTRAVTHLRGEDAAGALRALVGRDASGDLELDQRLSICSRATPSWSSVRRARRWRLRAQLETRAGHRRERGAGGARGARGGARRAGSSRRGAGDAGGAGQRVVGAARRPRAAESARIGEDCALDGLDDVACAAYDSVSTSRPRAARAARVLLSILADQVELGRCARALAH